MLCKLSEVEKRNKKDRNKSKVEKNVMLGRIETRGSIRGNSLYLFELVKELKEINYIKNTLLFFNTFLLQFVIKINNYTYN